MTAEELRRTTAAKYGLTQGEIMQYTDGPWKLFGPSEPTLDTPNGGDYAILDSRGCIIGEAFRHVETNELRPAKANAQLMAAAPDLLDACRAAAYYMMSDDSSSYGDTCNALVAAIAKATGEG